MFFSVEDIYCKHQNAACDLGTVGLYGGEGFKGSNIYK